LSDQLEESDSDSASDLVLFTIHRWVDWVKQMQRSSRIEL
jgi:hypothetical protein